MPTHEPRILVLDNDEEMFVHIREHLPNNYKIDAARTTSEAVSHVLARKYDVIIVDLLVTHDSVDPTRQQELQRYYFYDLDMFHTALIENPNKLNINTPVIVVTGQSYITIDDMRQAITDYGGWIWGWHFKSEIGDGREFRQNVVKVVNVSQSHSKESFDLSKLTIGDILRKGKISHLATTGAALAAIITAAFWLGGLYSQLTP